MKIHSVRAVCPHARAVLVMLPFMLLASAVHAQTTQGHLYGTVTDQQGSALPGVTVTVNPSEGPPLVQVTNAQGQFRFLNLDPGAHDLKAELEGFATVSHPNIRIGEGRNTTLEVTLSPTMEDDIRVTSESPLLDERRISSGVTVNQLELEKIPTARDPWAILRSTPGVLIDRTEVGGNESGPQSQFAGGRGDAGSFAIDGIIITDPASPGWAPSYYDFDSFEEFQISTGGTDVQTGGVVLNVVTRRGTNEWRGSGRYLLTDDRDWQGDDFALEIRERDDGGICFADDATLGGQIFREPMWFFANPRIEGEGETGQVSTPVANDRFWWFFGSVSNVEYEITVTESGNEGRSMRIPGCNEGGPDLNLVDIPNYGTPAEQSAGLGAILLGEPVEAFPTISITDPLGPARNHEAVELTLNRRFSNNWQLFGSAVYVDPAAGAPAALEFGQGATPAGDPCLEVGAIGPDGQPLPEFFQYGAGVILFDGPFVPPLIDFTRDPLCDQSLKISFLSSLPDATHVVLGEGIAGFDMDLAARRSLDFSFSDMVAPRVGFTWDVARDGRSKLYGHYGSFYESVPLDIGGASRFGAPGVDLSGGLFVIGIDLPESAGEAPGGVAPWFDVNGDGQRDLVFLNGGDFQTPCPGVQYGAFTIQPGEGGGHLVPDPNAPPIDCDGAFIQDRFRPRDFFSSNLGVRRDADEPPLDASTFFNTGNTSHELKFGGSYRSSSSWNDSNTIFVNDRWRLNDNWSFNLGLRYEEVAGDPPTGGTRPDPIEFEDFRGGPIFRDRLWIWGSYGRLLDEPAGDLVDRTPDGIRVGPGGTLEIHLDPDLFNPSFLDVGLNLEGQNYGARLRIEGNGERYGPGGSIADLADEQPLLLFESLGGSTGEVVRAHLLHDGAGPVSAEGFAVLEPVETTDRLRERFDAAIRGAAAKATATVEAYCLDKTRLPLSAGELFRLAPRAVQEAYAHVGEILDAAERLRDAGLLNPDTDPDSYFHSIRQWAVWTRQEGYDAREFVDAFVEHTRKNVEDGGQRWTDEIEEIVRQSAGGRWRDVEKVLDEGGTR